MISTRKSFVIKALPLVLIVFSISLIPIADGFRSQSTAGWVYELNPGESQVGTWTINNIEDVPINIEFSVENKGSEFFVFEKVITFEPKEKKSVEFIVSIPDDHPDNVEYRVKVVALEKAPTTQGGAAAVLINYQMFSNVPIKIGDDPVFTPEPEPIVEEEPEPIIEERPSEEDFAAAPEPETIEEKLKRIQEANEAKVDDDFEESFEEEAVTDYEPEPEYEMVPEPVAIQEEKIECDFFAWILSLFGMAKC